MSHDAQERHARKFPPIDILTHERHSGHDEHMTTQPQSRIPEVTLGWRLKIALGDMSAQEMAESLGVSRQTLSRWMADRGQPPRKAYINQWALLTGVDAAWLESGFGDPRHTPPDGPRGGGDPAALARYTERLRNRSHSGTPEPQAPDTRAYPDAA